jgi:hypothetical protein
MINSIFWRAFGAARLARAKPASAFAPDALTLGNRSLTKCTELFKNDRC